MFIGLNNSKLISLFFVIGLLGACAGSNTSNTSSEWNRRVPEVAVDAFDASDLSHCSEDTSILVTQADSLIGIFENLQSTTDFAPWIREYDALYGPCNVAISNYGDFSDYMATQKLDAWSCNYHPRTIIMQGKKGSQLIPVGPSQVIQGVQQYQSVCVAAGTPLAGSVLEIKTVGMEFWNPGVDFVDVYYTSTSTGGGVQG